MATAEIIDGPRYRGAIDKHRQTIADERLLGLSPDRNERGQPRSYSGGFAYVFEFRGRRSPGAPEERVAVRCFRNLSLDLAERYRAISADLERFAPNSRFFVETRYVPEGIRVGGKLRPITTLQWIAGDHLDRYISTHRDDKRAMDGLATQLYQLGGELERWGVAHGDLQHRNMLVTADGRLKLIDYDGMYVRALKGLTSNEAGHPDYAHPDRGDPQAAVNLFGSYLDRFPLIVTYLQVAVLATNPELWLERERTEGLLLGKDDFLEPQLSKMLKRIEVLDRYRIAVDELRRYAAGSIEEVPRLSEFLSRARLRASRTGIVPRTPARNAKTPEAPKDDNSKAAPVVPASPGLLNLYDGALVTVVAKVSRSPRTRATEYSRQAHISLGYPGEIDVVVLCDIGQSRAPSLERIQDAGGWVKARGRLTATGEVYRVAVEDLKDLVFITERDARELLGPGSPQPRRTPQANGIDSKPRLSGPEPNYGSRLNRSEHTKDLSALANKLHIPLGGSMK